MYQIISPRVCGEGFTPAEHKKTDQKKLKPFIAPYPTSASTFKNKERKEIDKLIRNITQISEK